jgi:hypothetical protein
MNRAIVIATAAAFLIVSMAITPTPAEAQQRTASARQGAVAKVHFGLVVGLERVNLKDNSAIKGALVGGTIAAVSSSGKSGKKRRRNTVVGAVVGGAAAKSPPQTGMLYTVEVEGGLIQVVTDQTEIHMGDCVAVEESGGGANIRRVSPEVCDPAARETVVELEEKFQEEAEECAAAKRELLEAETDEQIERALRKIKILCDE